MSARTIRLERVRRVTAAGEVDELPLKRGVNVIVGLKDTGKTGWLNTISFLLGDPDGPEKAFGVGITTKFDSASLKLVISDEEEVTLERRWKESGAKHKIFINGAPIPSSEFSQWIQNKLGIPTVKFPKGNPYSGATWPELSWRMLFRHIYLEERFWNDLAEKQHEREQHACLLQFLGGADKLYPTELGDEIKQRNDLLRLRARKEQFEEILQEATKGLVSDASISTAPTRDAIERGLDRLRSEIAELRLLREQLLVDTVALKERKQEERGDIELAERRLQLVTERERLDQMRAATEQRVEELSGYRTTVFAELTRIKRVEVASELFKPLSVTRCPHCDQKVKPETVEPGTCFVCHQNLPTEMSGGWNAAKRRLDFEHEQLEGEDHELTELVERLQAQKGDINKRLRELDEQIATIDVQLRPARAGIAAVLPPRLGEYDTKVGQLEERVAQLLRLRQTIEQRDQLAADIDRLAATVQTVASDVDAKSASIPFEQISDAISDGINEYLNILNEGDRNRWPHEPPKLRITERSFKLMVGAGPWSKVGASSGGLLVLAYHYALLKLSRVAGYNYPGLVLIDFPMTLADGASIANKENYLVEPFIALAKKNPAVQAIICGRAFRSLKGVNRIPLNHAWTQGTASADLDQTENADSKESQERAFGGDDAGPKQ